MVTYDPTEDPEVILDRAAAEKTKLTAFFRANANPALAPTANAITYQEFPQSFTYNDEKKSWGIRKKGFAIGRMVYVPPNGGERFYLRTLLTVVKGPTSFAHLRTVNGTLYPTFCEACLARGLLEDDGEWRQCLQEAAMLQTGTRLRNLFATILIFCEPTKPEVLWHEFRQYICDDLRHRLSTLGRQDPLEEEVYDYGLYLLNQRLHQSSRRLSDFSSMPLPRYNWEAYVENPLVNEQLNYDRDAERDRVAQREPRLNEDQRSAYERVLDSVRSSHGRMFFLNGPGGTGKTFVYNTLCHQLRSEGAIILCVASSGIVALLLKGGHTAHSMFKIPVEDIHSESMCAVTKESHLAGLLRLAKLIIWDEATMQLRYAFEAVDHTCRDVRNSEQPFGGITVVFGGDFQQILPVVVKGSREDIVSASLQRSYLWPEVNILRLQRNMRLEGNDDESREFAQWLLDTGHGRNTHADGTVNLPERMCCPSSSALTDAIYLGIGEQHCVPPPDYFLQRIILAARNSDVEDLNADVSGKMYGDCRTYHSADSIVTEAGADEDIEENPFPPEFLQTLSASGLPPGELHLKIGCPLILLCNLAPAIGLCNGTRMVLLRMTPKVLEVRLIGGDHDGDIAMIPRTISTPSGWNADFSFKLRRRQFPIRLAFAITINKAQGQSAKYVGLDLRTPVFSHGQLYVALSRATSSQRIRVLLPDNSLDSVTTNVVYPKVLLD